MDLVMNIPATEDEGFVFEDWCEELRLHTLEMTCVDPEGLWILRVYGNVEGNGFGDGSGYEYGYGGGNGYGNGYGHENSYGDGYGTGGEWRYGNGTGYRWLMR